MRPLAALAVALAACAPEVPDEPTWAGDVKPILDARCVRCHGAPAIGGAPAGFRLDRLADTDGAVEVVQGAGAMAEYLWRKVEDGAHPPGAPVPDDQMDVLRGWWRLAPDPATPPPRGAPRPGNTPPAITVTPGSGPPSTIVLAYAIADPDLETLHGDLRAGETFDQTVVLADDLRAGRGTAVVSTALLPGDDVRLWSVVRDGSIDAVTDLGRFDAGHGSDRPPVVRLIAPAPGAIVADADPPEVVFQVLDLDSPGPFTAEVRARRGDAEVVIAAGVPAPVGAAVTVPWDTAGLDGPGWEVEVTVTDPAGDGAGPTGGAAVADVIVSHATTSETFASISEVLAVCYACHFSPGGAFPGNAWDFSRYGSGGALGAGPMRNAIYRRAVLARDMPPPSSGLSLTDDARARLAAWLLAGAPETDLEP